MDQVNTPVKKLTIEQSEECMFFIIHYFPHCIFYISDNCLLCYVQTHTLINWQKSSMN